MKEKPRHRRPHVPAHSLRNCNSLSDNMNKLFECGDPPRSPHSQARWAKLRTTVQIGNAVTQPIKKKRKTSGVHRQDSFLKKFSTRQIAADGSSDSEDEDGESSTKHTKKLSKTTPTFTEAPEEKDLQWVINPDNNFMFCWLSLLSLSVLYNLWTCIAREAFFENQDRYQIVCWIVADIFCDILYILDIVVQLRTGYLECGLIVYNTKKLAVHYVCSKNFVLDLLSLIPLDFVQLTIGIHPIIRFPRFLKVYRSYRFMYMVESRTAYPNFFRVVNLSHVLLLGSHWFAAFYYLISKAEGFEGTWSYPKPVGQFASVTRKYLRSLYWSTLTLTTIGDLPPPDSSWQ